VTTRVTTTCDTCGE
jgi:hypothetical protein